MNVMKEFRNNLLKRKELIISIDAESNPGFEKVRQECVNYFSVAADNIVVKSIKGKFGRRNFVAEVFVYDSVENKNKIEPRIVVKIKKEEAK